MHRGKLDKSRCELTFKKSNYKYCSFDFLVSNFHEQLVVLDIKSTWLVNYSRPLLADCQNAKAPLPTSEMNGGKFSQISHSH